MAGIEQSIPQIGRIDPSSLIGLASPVVEPRATAALSEAFRSGVITADEITNRFGELGKTQDQAKLMQAQEAVSPEAQAARAATQQAQTVQAQQATRRAQFPGTAAFDTLGPGAGVEMPLLPDGSPDVQKENQIGTHLAAWDSTRKAAAEEEKRLVQHVDKATNTVMWLEPGGGPVPPARLAQLRKDAHMSFQDYIQKFPGIASSIFPGAGQTEAAVTPPAVTPMEVTPQVRAGLANKFGADTIAPMSDADVSRLFQSEQSTPPEVAPAVGAVVAPKPVVQVAGQTVGGGFALGEAPLVEAKPLKAPTEAQQRAQLALGRFAQSGDMIKALTAEGYDPASIGSWMNSMLPQIAKSGDRKQYEAAVDAWSQGLLRLESGAAISRQEKEWYDRAFFPQVADPPVTVASKEAMRHDIERMVAEIAQAGGVVSPESASQAQRVYERAKETLAGGKTPVNTIGVNAGPVLQLQSGRKLQRDANGQYRVVP